MKTVLIFRERLLASSETFITAQAGSLQHYRPVLAGLRRTTPSLRHSLPQILLREGHGLIDKVAANLYRKFPLLVGRNFYSRLKAAGPSIIHAHFATDAVQALPIARTFGVPLVVSLHGFDVNATRDALCETFSGRHYWKHRERLFREASAFICVSQFIRRSALKAGFPEDKLHVHYTGIDCERFQPAPVEGDPKLILFVGRLVEVKGCEYLLRAMALLQQQDSEAHLEVIGDGPLRPQLEALAAKLSLRVCFRGVQSSEEVMRSLLRARILCNPSATTANGDQEAFGMVFAEAQAVGTPVVSFVHGAIPEAVSHGETGLLCREKDVDMLADSLRTLLADDARWTSMSRRASEWVRERFDLAQQSVKLESLYDDCVANYQGSKVPLREAADWSADRRALSKM